MSKFLTSKKVWLASLGIFVLLVLVRVALPIVFRQEGTVIGIQERCDGVEYHAVTDGSACPCKISVEYEDGARQQTSGEMSPCGTFLGLYSVGDKVSLDTSLIWIADMLNYAVLLSFVVSVILYLVQRKSENESKSNATSQSS